MLSKMRNLLARFGPMSPAAATKAATVPLCAVCAGYPLVVGPLVAAGVIGSGAFLHIFIPVLAPINLWLLRTSFREHCKPLGLILAAASIPFILAHMAGHFFVGGDQLALLTLIWAGGGLLVAGLGLGLGGHAGPPLLRHPLRHRQWIRTPRTPPELTFGRRLGQAAPHVGVPIRTSTRFSTRWRGVGVPSFTAAVKS